ncbi:MAG: bifunctional diaminohydroxyphosphoribosylaminopyrimidine deaminase/5-amino-6-(5-phosphoribosylamino)uracil reductase RibD, partial [Chloroflexi bacterium]|nr:bifunctional diaminohydroxyphosphoribosylaminopyrimidine deaminase/5-amino-6-(5-phosphoribosylamino)uracil reductase RibD [Chloroflexota bacterium]
MRLALDLARRGLGRTHPNPAVGAVIVRDGRVVGRGFHPKAGEPHAEIFALREAGDAARGAVMYVTLEPCVHHGRTPPCVDAILEAGIAEVHIATLDPNPVVHGQGVAKLRAAGVKVVLGEGQAEARKLIEGFAHWVRTRRPWVVAKYAMTLDGKIATRTGHARWITGPEARAWVHRLRDQVDAILVGRGTVEADDPRLTTRLPDADAVHHPLRVVLDSRGRAPLTARVFDPGLPGRTVLAATPAL